MVKGAKQCETSLIYKRNEGNRHDDPIKNNTPS